MKDCKFHREVKDYAVGDKVEVRQRYNSWKGTVTAVVTDVEKPCEPYLCIKPCDWESTPHSIFAMDLVTFIEK